MGTTTHFHPRRNHKRGGVAFGLRSRWSCFKTYPGCLVFSAQRWNGPLKKSTRHPHLNLHLICLNFIPGLTRTFFQNRIACTIKMKKVKEKEAPDLSSLLVFGYACKLFRCINDLQLPVCFLSQRKVLEVMSENQSNIQL